MGVLGVTFCHFFWCYLDILEIQKRILTYTNVLLGTVLTVPRRLGTKWNKKWNEFGTACFLFHETEWNKVEQNKKRPTFGAYSTLYLKQNTSEHYVSANVVKAIK